MRIIEVYCIYYLGVWFCVLVENCCAELLISTNICSQLEHKFQLFVFFLIFNLTKLLAT